MTEHLVRPSYASEISSNKRRLDALERELRRLQKGLRPPELTFIFSGGLLPTTSPKKRSPVPRRYRTVLFDLTREGTTNTVVRLLKNGAALGSDYTIPAGVTFMEARLSVTVQARNDYLQARIVTPGAAALDLTVDLWQ